MAPVKILRTLTTKLWKNNVQLNDKRLKSKKERLQQPGVLKRRRREERSSLPNSPDPPQAEEAERALEEESRAPRPLHMCRWVAAPSEEHHLAEEQHPASGEGLPGEGLEDVVELYLCPLEGIYLVTLPMRQLLDDHERPCNASRRRWL
jgi:hypothetical protein